MITTTVISTTTTSLSTRKAAQHEQQSPHMTSLEVAEICGKQHFHVMEAIRKMEPAWEKVSSSKFRLSSRKVIQPNGSVREFPCYELTKTETLGMTRWGGTRNDTLLPVISTKRSAWRDLINCPFFTHGWC